MIRVKMEGIVGAYSGAKWSVSMEKRRERERMQDVEDGQREVFEDMAVAHFG